MWEDGSAVQNEITINMTGFLEKRSKLHIRSFEINSFKEFKPV